MAGAASGIAAVRRGHTRQLQLPAAVREYAALNRQATTDGCRVTTEL